MLRRSLGRHQQRGVRQVRDERLQAGIGNLKSINGDLLEYCIENGSKNNMTCIIGLVGGGGGINSKEEARVRGFMMQILGYIFFAHEFFLTTQERERRSS